MRADLALIYAKGNIYNTGGELSGRRKTRSVQVEWIALTLALPMFFAKFPTHELTMTASSLLRFILQFLGRRDQGINWYIQDCQQSVKKDFTSYVVNSPLIPLVASVDVGIPVPKCMDLPLLNSYGHFVCSFRKTNWIPRAPLLEMQCGRHSHKH